MEDFIPFDFVFWGKALSIMREAFDKGKKVQFTRGKFLIDGKPVSVD